jgi:hypothetical protein
MDRLGDTKVEAPTVILSMKIGAVWRRRPPELLVFSFNVSFFVVFSYVSNSAM